MEQIKEFWEWCGFKQLPKDIFYLAPNGTQYYDFQRREVLPAIDLNNLFKYAVPPVIQHIIKVYRPKWTQTLALGYIFDLWEDKINNGKVYDRALFEVLNRIRRY